MAESKLPPSAAAIKDAVASGRCSSGTVQELRSLLGYAIAPSANSASTATARKATASAAASKSSRDTAKPRPRAATKTPASKPQDGLPSPLDASLRDRLATEVVNAALQSLTAAVKLKASQKLPNGNAPERGQPLHPISPNQQPSAPSKKAAAVCPGSEARAEEQSVASLAECASAALLALRKSHTDSAAKPEQVLRLNQGVYSFVTKLIALGLDAVAACHLRNLLHDLGRGGDDPSEWAATLATRDTTAKAETKKECLSELMPVTVVPENTVAKDLLVVCQIQALKLAGRSRSSQQIASTLDVLLDGSQRTVVSLLEDDLKSLDAGAKAKCAKQLDQLSQAIRSLTDGLPQGRRPGEADGKETQSCIRSACGRLLELRLKCRSWVLTGTKIDSQRQLLDPMTSCMSQISRNPGPYSVSEYNQLVAEVKEFLQFLGFLPMALVEHSQLDVIRIVLYRALANLAKEIGDYEAAISWLKRCTDDSDSTLLPTCLLMTLQCQLAGYKLQLRAQAKISQDLDLSLQKACESLNSRLQGSPTEVDDLMICMSSLRKQVVGYLLEMATKSRDSDTASAQACRVLCKKYLSNLPRFLRRMLDHLGSGSSASAKNQSLEQRLKLVAQVAKPAVDAATLLAKASLAEKNDSAKELVSCLSECAQLSLQLEDMALLPPVDKTTAHSPFVNISNALWSRHLQVKRQEPQHEGSRLLLSHSVKVLETRSTEERRAGFLSVKHEKLGSINESLNDLAEAIEQYKKALLVSIELKVSARDDSSSATYESSIEELVKSCLRVQAKACASEQKPMGSLEFDGLKLSDQIQLLELQLALGLQSLQSDTPIGGDEFFMDIYRRLTEMYTIDDKNARLRLNLDMLHGACIDTSLFSDQILEGLLQERQGEETNLSGLHFQSQREAYKIMLKDQENLTALDRVLTNWNSLTSTKESFESHLRSINTGAWTAQLKLIEAFLQLHGNASMHATCLQVLIAIFSSEIAYDSIAVVTYSSSLGEQLAKSGLPIAAGRALLKVQKLVTAGQGSLKPSILWHLSYASYHLALGNLEKCEDALNKVTEGIRLSERPADASCWRPTKHEITALSSQLLHQYSKLAYARGQYELALYCSRKSSKMAYRSWALFEKQKSKSGMPVGANNGYDQDQSGISTSDLVISTRHESLKTTAYWILVPLLFEHTSQLVQVLLDVGLALEAQHYTKQAFEVAKASQSTRYQLEIAMLSANIKMQLGDPKKGLSELEPLSSISKTLTVFEQSQYHLALAKVHHAMANFDLETQVLKAMEVLLGQAKTKQDAGLASSDRGIQELQDGMKSLALTSKATTKSTKTQATVSRTRKGASSKSQSEDPSAAQQRSSSSDDTLVQTLQAARLRQSCILALTLGDSELAASLLSAAEKPSFGPEAVAHIVCQAGLYLHQGTSILARDPVFSLLQESAIMLPSKLQSDNPPTSEEVQIVNDPLPTARGRAARAKKPVAANPKKELPSKDTRSISKPLPQSNELLTQSSKIVQLYSSTGTNHHFSDLLARTQLLLSATANSTTNMQYSPQVTAWAIEMGRSVAYARERSSVTAERSFEQDREIATDLIPRLPAVTANQLDPSRFQEEFVDIIPNTWTVVSLALNEKQDELRISRLRSQRQPLTLTIPLERHNPSDCDEESFGFSQGKSELQEIISLANFSAHDTGDLSKKGAKTAWWEARAALDARLKDLMVNVENMWLGGFRGIFSQHVADVHLLSRFQQSMENILQKHLPSRAKAGKSGKQSQTVLDPQVLELFIGLGDPDLQPDMDDTLLELFYFVVDILQFNGERNAYDEVDFDPMVIETRDSLAQYHHAAKQLDTAGIPHHTILVLDKALHSFPWESMPFTEGQAISRLPSLLALKDRLDVMRSQPNASENEQVSLHVDPEDGAYVLNPSSDLASTHKAFNQPLSALTSWDATVNSLPDEKELSGYLKNRSIYLYFGHGSGGQYIRSRTIRRLPKCAVSLLMGCSSAIMTEAGSLESYGTPLTYLHAGAPAVVGTLWDVTDKDIDRYSLVLLERWGLLQNKGSSAEAKKAKKGKVKVKGDESPEPEMSTDPVSLDKAVAEARGSCILKYLNGAAPVVYGIPVSLKHAC